MAFSFTLPETNNQPSWILSGPETTLADPPYMWPTGLNAEPNVDRGRIRTKGVGMRDDHMALGQLPRVMI